MQSPQAKLSYVISRNKSEKTVKYRTPQGKEVCLTREVYLRDEISCKCLCCPDMKCKEGMPRCFSKTFAEGRLLPADIRLYLVVDGFYALNYWEVFEFEKIKGVIVTLSTAYYVQQQAPNRHPYKKIRAALEDPSQTCVLFDNEFHRSCFHSPAVNESAKDYTTRMNWVAAAWYQKHLGPKVSVVLVTDNKSLASQCAAKSVFPAGTVTPMILTLPELLQTYFSELTEAKLLLESLHASLETRHLTKLSHEAQSSINRANDVSTTVPNGPAAPQPGKIYPDHLSESALLAGLRSGQFLRGTLRVSRFRAGTEAMVTLTDSSTVKHQPELKDALATRSEIAVHGMQCRNRAIDGDMVAIRLLPRAQWTAVSSNISAAENNAAEVVDTASGPVETRLVDEPVNFVSNVTTVPCGFVVGVIGRNWRDYVCAYVPNESDERTETGWILATPWDRRIPRIRVHTTQATKLSQERFVVRIDSWDAGSAYPHGHFVQSLGRIGDLETETQTLLIEHNLAIRVFSDAQLNELAPYSAVRPWRVDQTEVKRRRDLRSPTVSGNPDSEDVLIFSIDPPGCQDVDDALSVRWLEPIRADDGSEHRRIQLGVHIADVTYFVPPGGFVDAEARRRSTSVYLADRRYDMLPGILSGDVCSLWSGVDRYAVSVIWEIDMDNLDVLSVWYGRTVIHSSYKLSYEVAQRIFDPPNSDLQKHSNLSASEMCLEKIGGVEELTKLVPELKNLDRSHLLKELGRLEESVKLLVDVASAIRVRRVARGGLELDSIEITVPFADPNARSGKLEDLVPKEVGFFHLNSVHVHVHFLPISHQSSLLISTLPPYLRCRQFLTPLLA
ncbi:DIS3 exonuclease 1 [Fasciola gigantica]|uniref:DIS3-like exonuclease 1 n=1 Tax=Fasciola gigantica TaxID=46835 RepID=A0A504YJE1_FASGI|nr:DIS3 exonuclease 1 [Fasciola gigantica]